MGIAEQIERITESMEHSDSGIYEEADEMYRSLLEKGFIKPRGYNLQTIEDRQRELGQSSFGYAFNVKH